MERRSSRTERRARESAKESLREYTKTAKERLRECRQTERLRECRQTDGFGSSVKMLLDLAVKLLEVGSSLTKMKDLAEMLRADGFGSDGMMLLDLAVKLEANRYGYNGIMLLDLAEKLQSDGIGSSEKEVLDLAEKLRADGIGSSEKKVLDFAEKLQADGSGSSEKVLDLAEKLQADGSGSSEKKVIDLAEKFQADGIESSEKMALDLAAKLQAQESGSSEANAKIQIINQLLQTGVGYSDETIQIIAEKLQKHGIGFAEEVMLIKKGKKKIPPIVKISDDVYTGKELEALKDEWLDESSLKHEWFHSLGFPAPWESVYSAGMDDMSQWPPIWNEKIEDCPEYESLAHFLSDPECTNPSDWVTKIILQQTLDSRGYDITLPCCGYEPLKLEDPLQLFIATRVCTYATDQINERAKEHDELYVFDEVKKIVERVEPPSPLRKCFYTFTVKEARAFENIKTVQAYIHFVSLDKLLVCVKEWRFKP